MLKLTEQALEQPLAVEQAYNATDALPVNALLDSTGVWLQAVWAMSPGISLLLLSNSQFKYLIGGILIVFDSMMSVPMYRKYCEQQGWRVQICLGCCFWDGLWLWHECQQGLSLTGPWI